jgi:hypothetical protein
MLRQSLDADRIHNFMEEKVMDCLNKSGIGTTALTSGGL